MSENPPPTPPDPDRRKPEHAGLPLVTSTDLLRGSREVLIEHQGEIYRLSLTRSGKLILHK